PKTGDIFTIADPDLQLNQLEEIQRDVAQLLEHGLNPPAPATENPAATAEQNSAAGAISETETEAAPQPTEAVAETPMANS
ncbi:MAG: hypothetical protein ACREDS_16385, partial [Limisphaerales bacterium]